MQSSGLLASIPKLEHQPADSQLLTPSPSRRLKGIVEQFPRNLMFTMMSSRLARPAIAATRRTASKTALRGYAAPAAADVKPPVALFGIDGTYASALVCKPEATSYRNQSTRFTKT